MKKIVLIAVIAFIAGVNYATDNATWYWLLDTEAKTIANVSGDGSETNWVLNVCELDQDNRTLTLGSEGGAIGNAYTYTQQTYEDGSVTNFIVGSGTMDFSTPIRDSSNLEWHATVIAAGKVFSAPKGTPHALTKFVFPTTLTKIRGAAFEPRGWGASKITSITMVCPELEEIPYALFNNNINVTYLLVKCPKVKTIGNQAFCELYGISDANSNADDWDLSGVETVCGDSSGKHGAFSYITIKGTLRLPNVKVIQPGAFYTSSINLELGLNRTLESVGKGAFDARNKSNGMADITPSSVVLCGSPKGWTMADGAMRLDSNLKQITILSDLPTLPETGAAWFSSLATKELYACFYLNDEYASVKAILDAATPATEDEIKTFTNANKTASAPYGIVEADVFNTGFRQFVGKADLSKYITPIIGSYGVYDDRYGDKVELISEGDIKFGQTITIKPTIKEGNTFAEWVGVPEGAVMNPDTYELTIKVGYDPIDVKLRTYHPWRLLRANTEENNTTTNRITDGVWELNVWIADGSKKELRVGHNSYAPGSAYTGVGSGILDLNGPIYEGTTEWTITKCGGRCFGGSKSTVNVVTELFLSTNIVDVGGDICFIGEGTTPVMTKLVANLPLVKNLNHGFDAGQTALEELVLNIPNVQEIGGYSFANRPNLKADVSTWRFDSLERLVYGGSFNSIPGLTGTLRLPSILYITNSVYNLDGIDALELGLAYTNGATRFKKTLQLPGGQTFAKLISLKTLVVGPYAGIEFVKSKDMFYRTSALKEVVFLGRPISKDAIDIILRGIAVPTDGVIKTALYVSANLDWHNADYVISIEDGDAEKAAADAFEATLDDGEYLLGIYNAANGERKAWIVHRKSVCEPNATILIIR